MLGGHSKTGNISALGANYSKSISGNQFFDYVGLEARCTGGLTQNLEKCRNTTLSRNLETQGNIL